MLIDAHASPVANPVWALYVALLGQIGPLPTLIEWGNDVPDWPVLMGEATRAQTVLNRLKELSRERVS